MSWSNAGAFVVHTHDVDPTWLGQQLRSAGFGWVAIYLGSAGNAEPIDPGWVTRFIDASGSMEVASKVEAARRAADHLMAWLEQGRDEVALFTFDTRLHGPRIVTGSAAVRLAKVLRRHGAWVVVPPASFLVQAAEGPLDGCELDHAREWAHEVLQAIGIWTPAYG